MDDKAQYKQFESEFRNRIEDFFRTQKRFSRILARSLKWSLVDFPIVLVNFPPVFLGLMLQLAARVIRSWSDLAVRGERLRYPKTRKNPIARLLPPYRTFSARSKLRSFKRTVILPMQESHPASYARYIKSEDLEDRILDIVTSWENVPNLLENILTPVFWGMGISFLGLDPKTVLILSRDKKIYHFFEQLGQGWFGRLYLRVTWLFDDSIPWTYSAKFIGIGLIAYIVLMILIEFVSVQWIHRDKAEQRRIGDIVSMNE